MSPNEPDTVGGGAHPHRGFETVTIAFEGSLAHRDTAGNSGVIGPGDVQWMTAASGVLHEEFHSPEFSRAGGRMHMFQLWVNLPNAQKMIPPRYQALTADQLGLVTLPGGGSVRIIAGSYGGVTGPAKTFTKINLFDVRLKGHAPARFSFPAQENTAFIVMTGTVIVNGSRTVYGGDLVLFENSGEEFILESEDAHLLLLSGEPIDEPVVQYGPFVMNTPEEIRQASLDFRNGKFGQFAG
jgi:quercetin 2,3-dioxygenase